LYFWALFTNLIMSSIFILCVIAFVTKLDRISLPFTRILMLLVLICMVRMLLPVDFSFTKSLRSEHVLPVIYQFIKTPFLGRYVSVRNILYAIWIGGFLWNVITMIRYEHGFRQMLTLFHEVKDEEILDIFRQANPKGYRIRLLQGEVPNVRIVGAVRPVILIPNRKIDAGTLTHILRHEVGHYAHLDLWFKAFIQLVQMLYWWLPLLKYFSLPVNEMAELRNDLELTKSMEDWDRYQYAGCIVEMSEDMGNSPLPSLGFHSDKTEIIKTRVHSIVYRTRMQARQIVILALLAVLVIIPFFVTVDARFVMAANDAYSGDSTQDDMYVLHEDGHYYLIVNGEVMHEIDKPQTDNITIIEKGEDVHETDEQ